MHSKYKIKTVTKIKYKLFIKWKSNSRITKYWSYRRKFVAVETIFEKHLTAFLGQACVGFCKNYWILLTEISTYYFYFKGFEMVNSPFVLLFWKGMKVGNGHLTIYWSNIHFYLNLYVHFYLNCAVISKRSKTL